MGVRSMPYVEAEGKPQFAGMGSGGSSGGGSGYTLPVASASTLGGVKIGDGVNVSSDGTISVEGGGGGINISTTDSKIGTVGGNDLMCIMGNFPTNTNFDSTGSAITTGILLDGVDLLGGCIIENGIAFPITTSSIENGHACFGVRSSGVLHATTSTVYILFYTKAHN